MKPELQYECLQYAGEWNSVLARLSVPLTGLNLPQNDLNYT